MPLPLLGVTVWIDERALEFIERSSLSSPRLETGGGLFGWSTEDGGVVACAFGPGPRAVRTPSALESDHDHTQELILAVHSTSQGRYRFVGSWHSHVGGSARPSGTDCRTAESMAQDSSVRLPTPMLLVVGFRRRRWLRRSRPHVTTGAFVWDTTTGMLREARLRSTELSDRYCPPLMVD